MHSPVSFQLAPRSRYALGPYTPVDPVLLHSDLAYSVSQSSAIELLIGEAAAAVEDLSEEESEHSKVITIDYQQQAEADHSEVLTRLKNIETMLQTYLVPRSMYYSSGSSSSSVYTSTPHSMATPCQVKLTHFYL